MELIADYHEVAVVGITEVLHKIPTVIGVQNRLAREAAKAPRCAGDPGGFARNASGRGAASEEAPTFRWDTSSGRRYGPGAPGACAS